MPLHVTLLHDSIGRPITNVHGPTVQSIVFTPYSIAILQAPYAKSPSHTPFATEHEAATRAPNPIASMQSKPLCTSLSFHARAFGPLSHLPLPPSSTPFAPAINALQPFLFKQRWQW